MKGQRVGGLFIWEIPLSFISFLLLVFLSPHTRSLFMGSSPTCLSTMNLRETMKVIGGPIIWGRDDLGRARETVYRRNEQPVYQILSSDMTNTITRWLRDNAAKSKRGDRIIIISIAHGWPYSVLFPNSYSTVSRKAPTGKRSLSLRQVDGSCEEPD